jgi:hypothetical protein
VRDRDREPPRLSIERDRVISISPYSALSVATTFHHSFRILSSSNAAGPSASHAHAARNCNCMQLQANAIRFSSLSCMRSREHCRLARGDCSQNSNANSRTGAVAQGKDVDREFEMKSQTVCLLFCFARTIDDRAKAHKERGWLAGRALSRAGLCPWGGGRCGYLSMPRAQRPGRGAVHRARLSGEAAGENSKARASGVSAAAAAAAAAWMKLNLSVSVWSALLTLIRRRGD